MNAREMQEACAKELDWYVAHYANAETVGVEIFSHIAAAIRALKVTGEGWRPIESAPKDGTRILACWGNDDAQIIWWRHQVGWCSRNYTDIAPNWWLPGSILPAPPSLPEMEGKTR